MFAGILENRERHNGKTSKFLQDAFKICLKNSKKKPGSDLDDSSCEEGKVARPVTEEVNTGWRTVARDSLNTAQPRERT